MKPNRYSIAEAAQEIGCTHSTLYWRLRHNGYSPIQGHKLSAATQSRNRVGARISTLTLSARTVATLKEAVQLGEQWPTVYGAAKRFRTSRTRVMLAIKSGKVRTQPNPLRVHADDLRTALTERETADQVPPGRIQEDVVVKKYGFTVAQLRTWRRGKCPLLLDARLSCQRYRVRHGVRVLTIPHYLEAELDAMCDAAGRQWGRLVIQGVEYSTHSRIEHDYRIDRSSLRQILRRSNVDAKRAKVLQRPKANGAQQKHWWREQDVYPHEEVVAALAASKATPSMLVTHGGERYVPAKYLILKGVSRNRLDALSGKARWIKSPRKRRYCWDMIVQRCFPISLFPELPLPANATDKHAAPVAKRKVGRPIGTRKTDPKADEKLRNDFRSSGLRTYEEFAIARGIDKDEVAAAINRAKVARSKSR